MKTSFLLTGKRIIVTGASSGIGRQCAIDCAKMGAKVVAIARSRERLEETLSLLEGEGHRFYSYDLSNYDGIADLVSTIVSDGGRIGGMVYAAGIDKTAPFNMMKPVDFNRLFIVNALSAIEMCRQVSHYKCFVKDGGSIVLIASITASIARACTSAYTASKGALVSTAREMAIELANRSIRVNCVSPGTILTPLMQDYLSKLTDEDYRKRVSGFPLGLGKTEDVSNACIFLLSEASRWITGQNIIVDGGFSIL